MNKFYVLAWDTYYPAGGMGNVKKVKHDKQKAIKSAKNFSLEYEDREPSGDYISGYEYVGVWDVSKDEMVWEE